MRSENEKRALEKQNQLNEQASGRTYCSKIRANWFGIGMKEIGHQEVDTDE